MKLLNYTSSYFSIILLIIIPIWAGLFYFAMLDEIYDSMDDGLGNQKLLIIRKADQQPDVLLKRKFDEGSYAIQPITYDQAKHHTDVYLDTLMYMQNENDFEPVRMLKTVFSHQNNFYSMKIITSMVEEDDLIFELFIALIWLYLGLMLSILVLNNLLLKKIWRPFNILIDQIGKFKLENPQPLQRSESKVDEFNTLHASVDKMMTTSVGTYQSQKEFIENASHELQTPVAMTLNKLELLAETGRLSKDQLNLISSALDNLTRLKRLNQSLLLLSRIDNRQFPETDQVNINQLTRRLLDDFQDLLEYRSLTCTFRENGTCVWTMHPDLASILISNLIKNAIVHNHQGGKLNILIEFNSFEIYNSGKDQPLDTTKIFNRFFKTEEKENSTGLGLAVVKAIANYSGISVNYSFNSGHLFKLRR